MPELEPITREEKFLNGEVGMTPITREEKILAGEDIETVTRREYFLKKYRGGGGGDVTVVPLSVTDNGTYSEEGKAYSPVSVNVPLPQNAYLLKSVANLPQAIASFNDGQEMVMPSLKVAIEPQQEGSGDPSPTNIRPISGWDDVNVTRAGKNLFSYDLPIRDGYWALATVFQGSNNIVTKENAITWQYIRLYVKGLSQITLSGFDMQGGTLCAWLGSEDINDVISTFNSAEKNGTKTVPQGAKYLCLVIYSIKTKSESYPNAQIELGNTATTYEPYNGHTYTIDLNGTRYGGEVDVVSGVLTVDRVMIDLSTVSFTYDANNKRWSRQFSDMKNYSARSADLMFEQYEATVSAYTGDTGTAFAYGNDIYIYDANQSLTISGKCVYKLATPQTIQLTPTAVKSLLGSNNVWADTGDITDVEYFSKEV